MHHTKALELLYKYVLTPNRHTLQRANKRQENILRSSSFPYASAGMYYCNEQEQLLGINLAYPRPSLLSLRPLAEIESLRYLSVCLPKATKFLRELNELQQIKSLQLSFYREDRANFSFHSLPHLDLERFICERVNLSDLAGIERWANLQYLSLSGCGIKDISCLAGLLQLKMLYLDSNQIEELSPLVPLWQLQTLCLNENPIQRCPPLQIIRLYAQEPNTIDIGLVLPQWQAQQQDLEKIWQLFRSCDVDNRALAQSLLRSLGWSEEWIYAFGETAHNVYREEV